MYVTGIAYVAADYDPLKKMIKLAFFVGDSETHYLYGKCFKGYPSSKLLIYYVGVLQKKEGETYILLNMFHELPFIEVPPNMPIPATVVLHGMMAENDTMICNVW